MSPFSRRQLFHIAATSLGSLAVGEHPVAAQSDVALAPGTRIYGGVNLDGWETIVGDATSPCQPHVATSDIETVHFLDYSEVRANILPQRDMMAHNDTFKSIFDPRVLDFVHRCSYRVRLPYLPATSNKDFNGQTIEGQIALWDGQTSQRLRSVAYQWMINPYFMFGTVQCWTSSGWQPVGTFPVDTEWHTISMVIDPARETTQLQIDSIDYPSSFVIKPKPTFGSDVSAVFAAEAISMDPGAQCTGGIRHRAQFKDWTWTWEPINTFSFFLPLVTR